MGFDILSDNLFKQSFGNKVKGFLALLDSDYGG
jgi:hypothetical protein